jgi:Tfp pilus assembly protein PilN
MIKINLVPKEILEKEKGKRVIFLASLVGIGVIGAVLGLYGLRVLKYNALKAELKTIEKKLGPLQAVIQQVDSIEAEKKKLDTKIVVIKTLLLESLVYPKFLQELSLLIPKNVWITRMDTKSKPEKLEVKLNLSASDNHGIAKFMATLENSENFEKVMMGAITTAVIEEVEIRNFDMSFNYKYLEGL